LFRSPEPGALGSATASVEALAKPGLDPAAGGELTALGDPVAFSGVLVTNTANTPVVAAVPDPSDNTGMLVWGNATGVAEDAGIRGIALVDTDGSGVLAVGNAAGATGFALHGGRGLVTASSAGDLAEVFLPSPTP
jgi:hypothetical protein